MKKSIILLIFLSLSFILFSCSKEDVVVLNAVIIECNETLLVEPDKDSNEYRTSDIIVVHTNDSVMYNSSGKKISLNDFSPGQSILITYDGLIAESYPAQIWASKIEALD